MPVSAIIPAFNGEKYIAEAIGGIRRQERLLRQGADSEIIVVDDRSADATAAIAEALGCRVIRHASNRGQVVGKNTGIRAATGRFILFHDQDDVMRPGALARLAAELDADASASAVMAKSQDFLSPEATVDPSRARKLPVWGMFSGATLFRREVFDAIGLFDEEGPKLNTGETIIVDQKMKALGLVMKKLDFVSVDRRIHDANFGIVNPRKEYQDYAAVLRAKMVRDS